MTGGFASIPNPVWSDPVWAEKAPGSAWRVYCWLLSRVRTPEDTREAMPFNDIARDLGCAWRSVQRSVRWLRENRFIITTWDEAAQAYRYAFPEGGRLA